MSIKILFFGVTADIVGNRELVIEHMEGTASKLVGKIIANYPPLGFHKLLFSVNQQYATGEELIYDGDEIAIFTAVSGG